MDNRLQAVIEKGHYIKMQKIQRFINYICLLFVLLSVFINFWWFYNIFIEVKCDYLVLPNNFRREFFRIHQIMSIILIQHIIQLKRCILFLYQNCLKLDNFFLTKSELWKFVNSLISSESVWIVMIIIKQLQEN